MIWNKGDIMFNLPIYASIGNWIYKIINFLIKIGLISLCGFCIYLGYKFIKFLINV